jgi:hypothetical protein
MGIRDGDTMDHIIGSSLQLLARFGTGLAFRGCSNRVVTTTYVSGQADTGRWEDLVVQGYISILDPLPCPTSRLRLCLGHVLLLGMIGSG